MHGTHAPDAKRPNLGARPRRAFCIRKRSKCMLAFLRLQRGRHPLPVGKDWPASLPESVSHLGTSRAMATWIRSSAIVRHKS